MTIKTNTIEEAVKGKRGRKTVWPEGVPTGARRMKFNKKGTTYYCFTWITPSKTDGESYSQVITDLSGTIENNPNIIPPERVTVDPPRVGFELRIEMSDDTRRLLLKSYGLIERVFQADLESNQYWFDLIARRVRILSAKIERYEERSMPQLENAKANMVLLKVLNSTDIPTKILMDLLVAEIKEVESGNTVISLTIISKYLEGLMDEFEKNTHKYYKRKKAA